MPSRKIPIATRSITGKHGSDSTPFESTLERDFVTLCSFDRQVESVQAQLIIQYTTPNGRNREYATDYLVTYKATDQGSSRRPRLCEIKYEEELKAEFATFKDKFEGAQAYAAERGWDFEVITDKEIRTPYLENAHFFLPFRTKIPIAPIADWILKNVPQYPKTITPNQLIQLHSKDREKQKQVLPNLWILLAQGIIQADFQKKLTMTSPIWCAKEGAP